MLPILTRRTTKRTGNDSFVCRAPNFMGLQVFCCRVTTYYQCSSTGEPDIYSPFDSEDDRRQGCRNVSHFHQQSFSRLH